MSDEAIHLREIAARLSQFTPMDDMQDAITLIAEGFYEIANALEADEVNPVG